MTLKEKIKSIYINLFNEYNKIIGKYNSWAYISYLSEVYYIKNKTYMLSHQNKRESLIIRDVFNDIGYNFKSIRYDRKISNKKIKKIQKQNIDIVFGIEPNFVKICDFNPNALKIYYATGSYYEHQNYMIKKRTDEVNRKYNSNISYARLVPYHKSIDVCDYIIQIGNKTTVKTYPYEIRDKILTIRQSSFEFLNLDMNEKSKVFSKNDYLWFGGKGAILKGLDLLLEYFEKNKNLNLHIIGKLEDDFKEVFKNKIFNCSNIKYYGYMKIDSSELVKIANKCSFIILPSCSEGGTPGSVLNMMRLGLIPIVSKFAALDEINEYGILIEDLKYEYIDKAIKKSQKINSKDMLKMFEKNYSFIKENYNLNTYKADLYNSIEKIKKVENIEE